MEISLEAIISLVGLLFGGGTIGGFLTWKYARKKAKAEAAQAEAEAKQKEAEAEKARYEAIQASVAATKEVQDSYQQLIADMKTDREDQRHYMEEQKQYIAELKEDRVHLRHERDELRKRQDDLEETMRSLQMDVARNSRMVAFMRPFLCGRDGCAIRMPVDLPGEESNDVRKRRQSNTKVETNPESKGIEPLSMKDL